MTNNKERMTREEFELAIRIFDREFKDLSRFEFFKKDLTFDIKHFKKGEILEVYYVHNEQPYGDESIMSNTRFVMNTFQAEVRRYAAGQEIQKIIHVSPILKKLWREDGFCDILIILAKNELYNMKFECTLSKLDCWQFFLPKGIFLANTFFRGVDINEPVDEERTYVERVCDCTKETIWDWLESLFIKKKIMCGLQRNYIMAQICPELSTFPDYEKIRRDFDE